MQFDTQGSDGVVTGFSFEQLIRPYKIVDPQLTAPLAIGDIKLPTSASGGGQEGRKAAFVPTAQAAAVMAGQLFPEPLVLHVAQGECVNVTLHNQQNGTKASFHVGGLLSDLNSAAINIGFNPDTLVAAGASRTYTFYADNP